jgi:hypothetical protein
MTECKFCGTVPNNGEKSCKTTRDARSCGWMNEADWNRWERARGRSLEERVAKLERTMERLCPDKSDDV